MDARETTSDDFRIIGEGNRVEQLTCCLQTTRVRLKLVREKKLKSPQNVSEKKTVPWSATTWKFQNKR